METNNTHEKFMEAAFREAMKARMIDEVPVGAVVVYDGKIIAKAHNRRETKKNPCENFAGILILFLAHVFRRDGDGVGDGCPATLAEDGGGSDGNKGGYIDGEGDDSQEFILFGII